MTWQPGQPVVTASDQAEWRAWRKASKLKAQRDRRAKSRRIDYYPDPVALGVIEQRAHRCVGGDYSSVIDALVIAGLTSLRNTSLRNTVEESKRAANSTESAASGVSIHIAQARAREYVRATPRKYYRVLRD